MTSAFVPAEWPWFHYLRCEFTRSASGQQVQGALHYAVAKTDLTDEQVEQLVRAESSEADAADSPPDFGSDVVALTERYVWNVPVNSALHGSPEEQSELRSRWEIAERLLTHLWLVAGLSYYKTAAAPQIRVHGDRPFSAHDLGLHQLLLTRGLGEFCFVNGLDPELHPTWLAQLTDSPIRLIVGAGLRNGPLVPVGGGKDSCVTIEALRGAERSPTLVTVRRFPIIQDVIEASGIPDVAVERTIDQRIVVLNNAGALNGHVPATAIVSFAALVGAALGGHDALVMSNERSASEGNVEYRGVSINHQWAKSEEAEAAIAAAVARISPELRWFSLLRPLSELDISRRFAATCQRYFSSFSSCNRTQRIDPSRRVARWCGECPKCQFVYLALCTSLSRDQVETIWGAELFASSPIDGFRALLGLADWKPFECVGEHVECRVALASIIDQPEWADHRVLRQLADEVRDANGWPTAADHAGVYGLESAPVVPLDYLEIIRAGSLS